MIVFCILLLTTLPIRSLTLPRVFVSGAPCSIITIPFPYPRPSLFGFRFAAFFGEHRQDSRQFAPRMADARGVLQFLGCVSHAQVEHLRSKLVNLLLQFI